MGLSTLTDMPSVITAGDTLLVSLTEQAYPASDGWSLKFSFRAREGSVIDLQSAQDGATNSHLIQVDAATTAAWAAKVYTGIGKAIGSSGTVTFWRGTLEVKPDLGAQPGDFDGRSWQAIALEQAEAAIASGAGRGTIASTIAGQSFTWKTATELFAIRDRLLTEVQQQQAREQAEQGKHARNTIGITFTPL